MSLQEVAEQIVWGRYRCDLCGLFLGYTECIDCSRFVCRVCSQPVYSLQGEEMIIEVRCCHCQRREHRHV